jgi:hypothetical protein
MRKEEGSPRFGPEHWVTIRETGEHVQVEAWSSIAAAYRVRSRKSGLLVVTEEEVDELLVHPEVHLGKHWSRCPASGCGAPLTPALPVCPRCHAPTCTCGRCQCVRPSTPSTRARPKATRKKTARSGH